jgi:hypothetical protein
MRSYSHLSEVERDQIGILRAAVYRSHCPDAPSSENRRGEPVERSFAHILDRGGMRRAWLRGRENLHKRYLIHVAGFNLGVLMRAPCTVRELPERRQRPASPSFSPGKPTHCWFSA